jgi:hypothetical protein
MDYAKVLSNPDTNACYVYDANVEKELMRDPIPRVEYKRKENFSSLILNDSIKNAAYFN